MSITVAVTHYNQADLLPTALRSLVAQTLRPQEIIVIDDGSDTELRRSDIYGHLGSLQDRTSLVCAPHRSVGASLNLAIKLMRGDVLCWLPADDWWKPLKLERQSELASGCHGNYVLHSFCEVWVDDKLDHPGIVPDLTPDEMRQAIRHSSPYYANTFWIPRRVLDLVGPFREDVPVSEDYEWVLRSVVKRHVEYKLQPEVLAAKRVHGNSLTARLSCDIPYWVRRFNEEIDIP